MRNDTARTCALSLLLTIYTAFCPEVSRADTLTQHKINEIAAKCVTAQMAFSGLHGAPKKGETPEQFKGRIKGYLDALDTVEQGLAPIKQKPTLVNISAENSKRWQEIVSAVNRLPGDVAEAKSAWKAYPTQGEKAKLGNRLAQSLATVQVVLSGLRDAKP